MSDSEQVEQRMNYTTYVAIDESCPFPSKVHVYRDQSKKTRTYVPERTCERTYHPNRSRASGPQLTCSECGYGASDDRWAFCPKCGARYENTCHEAIRAVSE